jgi:beta-phosphoglucomutase family hydrolase
MDTHAISRDRYDAVLFDLDGVITNTAALHALCWKRMFDEYLQTRAAERHELFRPFELVSDYQQYVDGKPRYAGVRDFLASRGIQLPKGSADDPPQAETVRALGTRKNELLRQAIAEGVETFEGSVRLLHQLRQDGFKIAVVTSSRNCTAVLKAAGLDACFDAQVDGKVIQALGLRGKPAPDGFLLAAKLLSVEPSRAVVIDDAISGVQAGVDGGFGLVIGVAREGDGGELHRHGAHLVVNDLSDLASIPFTSTTTSEHKHA